MLPWLIGWSLRNRFIVLALALLVGVAGYVSLRRLNIDAFPDTTPVQVQINTVAPALVPEEVERQITFPIEMAIGGMPGLEQLRSISQFGLSQVVVTFTDGTDVYFARQLINERLGTVDIPPGIDRPEMGPVSTGLGEVLHYILIGEGRDLTELRTMHDWVVKPAMRPVPGTAEINTWGGLKKQYQVRIDPTLLIKYDISWETVMQAVRENNLNVGGGSINRSGDMLLVHGVGRTNTIEQIEGIVVAAKAGVPIHVRDVAEVTIGHEIRRGVVTANGQGEVVLGLGFMLMGENSYAVTHRLADKLKEVKGQLPSGVRVNTVYDRTNLVDQVIDTVRRNLLDGGLLVIIILFVFLGDLRAGLIVALAIPMAMLFGFCGMLQAGIAGTLLSLGAIDFGIVVDSSVVVVENIVKRLAHSGPLVGHKRLRVIRDAAVEVRTPTVFGQLIIMIVYLPILTLQGVEGKMFRPMAITVMFVLTGSLILSLTLMPVLASLVLPKHIEERDALPIRLARAIYAPVLRFCLQFRYLVLAVALGGLIMAAALVLSFGSEFVPRLSEGAIVIGVVRPPGTSLEESIRVNTQIERMLLETFPDEVSHAWSRVGAPEVATDAGSVEMTDLFVALKPRERWKRAATQDELVELMEREVADIPGQINWFTQPIEQRINEMISGVRSDVAVKLFGDDFDTLVKYARELEGILREVRGSVDLATEQIVGQPVLQIRIRQDQIARYGVSALLVLDTVQSIGGIELGDVIEGQIPFPLTARLPEHLRSNPDAIKDILISTPAGEHIPLSRLADVTLIEGPKTISREWSKRRITVQCNVRGRDVGSFVAEAQAKIDEQLKLPEGYRIDWGGQFENLQRAKFRLAIVVPVALAMIVVLLYFTYHNLTDTAIVFASVPFACIGGIVALALREMPLSISAAIGFITLSGVSVLNSMVLVSALRHLLHGGTPVAEAVPEAALSCLRTIIMTALVASVGFIPMATSSGTGAEVQRPLATVVIGGVISSTLMTLVVLPAIYVVVGSRGKAAASGN
ncbi:MAG TPA: CusA/CzcA family heavy metal efflux RND transporter [Pirellulales bacterium]|nr:CusA/CzcA family heavy metal efflux RND transporter [Pirellulales bacterium]